MIRRSFLIYYILSFLNVVIIKITISYLTLIKANYNFSYLYSIIIIIIQYYYQKNNNTISNPTSVNM